MAKKKKKMTKKILKQRRSSATVQKEKTDRNDPCPCGSGKKYKKCCYQQKRSFFTRLSDKLRL